MTRPTIGANTIAAIIKRYITIPDWPEWQQYGPPYMTDDEGPFYWKVDVPVDMWVIPLEMFDKLSPEKVYDFIVYVIRTAVDQLYAEAEKWRPLKPTIQVHVGTDRQLHVSLTSMLLDRPPEHVRIDLEPSNA